MDSASRVTCTISVLTTGVAEVIEGDKPIEYHQQLLARTSCKVFLDQSFLHPIWMANNVVELQHWKIQNEHRN